MALKFFYNGVRDSTGLLHTAFYSDGRLIHFPEGTISIYAREYMYGKHPNRHSGFSSEIRESFKVENDTDLMSDYHDKDRIRVTPDHPLYKQVAEGLAKARARSNTF